MLEMNRSINREGNRRRTYSRSKQRRSYRAEFRSRALGAIEHWQCQCLTDAGHGAEASRQSGYPQYLRSLPWNEAPYADNGIACPPQTVSVSLYSISLLVRTPWRSSRALRYQGRRVSVRCTL